MMYLDTDIIAAFCKVDFVSLKGFVTTYMFAFYSRNMLLPIISWFKGLLQTFLPSNSNSENDMKL